MQKTLKNYFDLVAVKYPFHRVLAVLVRGSQNYNQSTAASDLDVVAVILPPLADLARGLGSVSTTLHTDTGDILVQSFDFYCKNLSKANPVFLETMTTPYYAAITLYAAASFAKTPADFSVGEPPRCHGALERPIGRYTHYMCQTIPNKPIAQRLPMDYTFDTGRAYLSGYGVPVIALAFMSCDALEEAMRDPLPFSQAEYEAADEEATIHNLWRLKENRRFTSTIITEGGVKYE